MKVIIISIDRQSVNSFFTTEVCMNVKQTINKTYVYEGIQKKNEEGRTKAGRRRSRDAPFRELWLVVAE
ncbi:hypothetical protein ERHA55_20280 [Erwinia rhapontici]|nr:hypothetical protein ERHA55_20280 [Erwinia rhapontici]